MGRCAESGERGEEWGGGGGRRGGGGGGGRGGGGGEEGGREGGGGGRGFSGSTRCGNRGTREGGSTSLYVQVEHDCSSSLTFFSKYLTSGLSSLTSCIFSI